MIEKIVRVDFSRVVRVTDNFVRVRANSGQIVQVDKPHDKTIEVRTDGTGYIKCPQHVLKQAVSA